MGISLQSPTRRVLDHASGWLKREANGLAKMYEIERRRRGSYSSRRVRRAPLLTPDQMNALAKCATTHLRASHVLKHVTEGEVSYRGEPPWGGMIVARIEDGRLRFLARTWERCAVTEDADAALRAAWMARWSFLYG
jgi:hypothetical protein